MTRHILRTLAFGTALTGAVFAQNQRQAVMTGGGSPDRGKCTVEVMVDGVAQVEIQGASATLRNVSGQPPQWRRFECTGAMPANPANFRFSGVDGRGRQELVRDPRNGGAAVVQIEDKEGGAEGYTFDITWDARGGNTSGNGPYTQNSRPGSDRQDPNLRPGNNGQYDPNYRPIPGNAPVNRENDQYRDRSDNRFGGRDEDYRPNYRDSQYYRQYGHGFATDEAVRICQDEVMRQASQRFRTNDIHFGRTRIDDNPGRQDWVMGSLDIHRGNHEERYGFSCSVNFDNGRVRSAQLDPRPIQ